MSAEPRELFQRSVVEVPMEHVVSVVRMVAALAQSGVADARAVGLRMYVGVAFGS